MKSTNKPSFKPPNPDILQLAEKHANQPEALLEVLKEAQKIDGHLKSETITDVARALKVPVAGTYPLIRQALGKTRDEVRSYDIGVKREAAVDSARENDLNDVGRARHDGNLRGTDRDGVSRFGVAHTP